MEPRGKQLKGKAHELLRDSARAIKKTDVGRKAPAPSIITPFIKLLRKLYETLYNL